MTRLVLWHAITAVVYVASIAAVACTLFALFADKESAALLFGIGSVLLIAWSSVQLWFR